MWCTVLYIRVTQHQPSKWLIKMMSVIFDKTICNIPGTENIIQDIRILLTWKT